MPKCGSARHSLIGPSLPPSQVRFELEDDRVMVVDRDSAQAAEADIAARYRITTLASVDPHQ